MRQAGDETLAQLLWLKYTGLTAPEASHRGERSPGPAIRRPSLGVVATTALVERPKGALCKAKVTVIRRQTRCYQLICTRSQIEQTALFDQGHGIAYPFDCGDHAVNIPGKGLLDLRVQAVSSQYTQSALMSNVDSESGAVVAALTKDETATNSVVAFIPGNQDLPKTDLEPRLSMYRLVDEILCRSEVIRSRTNPQRDFFGMMIMP